MPDLSKFGFERIKKSFDRSHSSVALDLVLTKEMQFLFLTDTNFVFGTKVWYQFGQILQGIIAQYYNGCDKYAYDGVDFDIFLGKLVLKSEID